MVPVSVLLVLTVLVVWFVYDYVLRGDYRRLSGVEDAQVLRLVPYTDLASAAGTSNFAYSLWIYVEDWGYRYGQPKVLFRRGRNLDVSLGERTNTVVARIACYPSSEDGAVPTIHTCVLPEVPLQRWVHVAISVFGKTMDMYLDGKLVKTCVLPGIAVVKAEENLEITPDGGFVGRTADVLHYGRPLAPQEVWRAYSYGHNPSLWGRIFGRYSIQVRIVDKSR